MWEIIEKAFRYSNKHCAEISPNESLWDFFQKEVAKRIPETETDFQRKRDMIFKIAESWGAFVGSHIFTQSLKYFWLEECIEGENLFCAGTYKNILERIAKSAREGALIKYETVVTNIQSSGDDGGPSKVLTEDGQTFEFDEVVVYISFPEAFWLKSESEEQKVRGFCQWLAPRYAPETNPHKWNQEMVELASLGSASHPTLLFYTYGDQSRYLTGELAKLLLPDITTNTNKDKNKRTAAAFLYDWFRPYYARLPGYDPESPACRPAGCYATQWLHDELAGRGSYSNFQVGLEAGDADIEAMREGVPERGLWLAGEHTAPFVALGTATGAYWSGESVGGRIASAYGLL
ncbi:putative amine oxidase protein [Eutypa lata UCREL1]|uniref:Putative amine oxidase protein n=1 Tax=Eutypa lata (strain UCR-EL1) TaxID=1287681 RepID=M7TFH2_EUTLA|nr:putative amine oxidase protein [Eutypa lata UCREL1]